MKRFAILSFVALLCTFVSSAVEYTGKLEAFPGAEGYGRYTTGGRGGKVIKVTNLLDDGNEGSFRYAVEQAGARTIVFEVSGTIHLTKELNLRNGNVTIAGQTAPGDGICVTDYPFNIRANNVIIRFIRFRLGNKNATVGGADGWDGLGCLDQKDIIVDHCSVSWSLDECLSFSGTTNTTVQWCIVSQSLVNSGHSKGNHGYGGNWGGEYGSYHHNLLAHHTSRAPRLGPRPTTQLNEYMDMRKNVMYNYSGEGCYGGEGMNVNIVNNYYKPGPGNKYVNSSKSKKYRIASVGIRTNEYCANSPAYLPALHKVGTYYVDGNENQKFPEVKDDNWEMGMYNQIEWSGWDDLANTAAKREQLKVDMKLALPIEFEYTTTHTALDAYTNVTKYAGACRMVGSEIKHDALDRAIFDDAIGDMASLGTGDEYDKSGNLTGAKMGAGFINSITDINYPSKYVAGVDYDATTKLPILNSETAPKDTDGDGIPDEWEEANGLDPNDPTDGAKSGKLHPGFTNLEVYMNSLVQSIMDGGNVNGKMLNDQLTYADSAVDLPVYDPSLENPDKPEAVNYDLSVSSYLKSEPATNWIFDGGFSIENGSGKGYGAGTENCIKYSRNVQFTVKIPEGVSVAGMTITGYDNYDDVDAYIAEINGQTVSGFDFPKKDTGSKEPKIVSHEYNFVEPVSGSFTFTPKGQQVGLKFTLRTVTGDHSGIDDIEVTPEQPAGNGKIYNLLGVEVKEPLLPGVYIRDGKKFLVR